MRTDSTVVAVAMVRERRGGETYMRNCRRLGNKNRMSVGNVDLMLFMVMVA
jgi:hypothetical protein